MIKWKPIETQKIYISKQSIALYTMDLIDSDELDTFWSSDLFYNIFIKNLIFIESLKIHIGIDNDLKKYIASYVV